jgi:hypothetical protein
MRRTVVRDCGAILFFIAACSVSSCAPSWLDVSGSSKNAVSAAEMTVGSISSQYLFVLFYRQKAR